MGQKKRTTRQSLRRIMTMTALLLIAMVASGCTVFDGGGFLRSANLLAPDTEKATFGINGKCQEGQVLVIDGKTFQGAGLGDGQFQYDDHAFPMKGVGVQFHGEVTGQPPGPEVLVFNGMTCQEAQQFLSGGADSPGVATFAGTYRPQDKALAKACPRDPATSDCTFTGGLSDMGEPGIQNTEQGQEGDVFTITVTGGPFAGYTNTGPIQGGNIQVS